MSKPDKSTLARKVTAAAFIFFLAKGIFWLAAGTGLVLAAR